MHKLHRLAAALAAAACFSGAAHATPFSTDVTDLWYNPDESGWGLSLYQQQATVFAVLFVYGPDGQPTWYVASSLQPGDNNGTLFFSGTLYRTNGPYFGGPFNPAAVGIRPVGTATFTLGSLTSGTFAYTVDGVGVTKSVTRQTWATQNMTGRYVGGQAGTYSACPGLDGTRDEGGLVTVSQGGNSATLSIATTAATCTYTGAYAQSGHYGLMSGSYSCSNGRTGSFSAFALDAQIGSLAGRLDTVGSDGCRYSGRIGGIRGS